MSGSNWTSGSTYGPEDRRREFKRQVVGVLLVTGVILVSISVYWEQGPVTALYLLALIAAMLLFLLTQYRAVKPNEADTGNIKD